MNFEVNREIGSVSAKSVGNNFRSERQKNTDMIHFSADRQEYARRVGGTYQTCQKQPNIGNLLKTKIFREQDSLRRMNLLELVKNVERTNCPRKLDPSTASFSDVAIHAIMRQRLSAKKGSTVEHRIRYAQMMEMHSKFPVDFRNPNPDNFFNHMDYREQHEGATNALKHEWKTMKMFLTAYAIPFGKNTKWDYKPPHCKKGLKNKVPRPEIVHEIISHNYAEKDSYKDALIKYLLTHNFMIGWRYPSEPFKMKVSDVNLDEEFIIITETKKDDTQRRVPLPHIVTGKNKKSLQNWIKVWRPKVENDQSGDALYLMPDGKPFPSKHALSSWMDRNANHIIRKEIYPNYVAYNSRHWYAIASLIQSKMKSKGIYDHFWVSSLLGHENPETLKKHYVKDADFYHKIYGENWIGRALKARNGSCEDRSTESSQAMKPQKPGSSPEITPVGADGPPEI